MFVVRSGYPALLGSCSQQYNRHATVQSAKSVAANACEGQMPQSAVRSKLSPWCKAILAAGSALVVAACPAIASEDLSITFRASRNPEIRMVQRSLVEAWGAFL